eukprot:gene31603-39793_t
MFARALWCLVVLPSALGFQVTTLGETLGRSARTLLPEGYAENADPIPLVVALHGYTQDAARMESLIRGPHFVDALRFVLILPNGLKDTAGKRYWNATQDCCNFYKADVDDVGYVKGLISEARTAYSIDPNRVYVFGFSNGAFMAHRLACELSHELAGIVSIAGSSVPTVDECQPAKPLSILNIHGDQDEIILYAGGRGPSWKSGKKGPRKHMDYVLEILEGGSYPGAEELTR